MFDAIGSTHYSYGAAGQLLSEDGPWANDTVNYTYTNRLRASLSLLEPNGDPWTQGHLRVGGTTTSPATNVTVNGSAASRYADRTFALGGFSLVNGDNTFTAIAQDALNRLATNSITVNLPSSASYTYDLNGNLLSDSTRNFAYDDENQLTSVWVTNVWRSDFAYDGRFRRRIRREYAWSSGAWLQTNEVRYVYDGNLVIQERDANNLPLVGYTRGRDLSGTLQQGGGIGGLLARSDLTAIYTQPSNAHAYYHCDALGNITALIGTNQLIVARYVYDPFGNLLSKIGWMADANLYRFASKEVHVMSGLVYFLYRYFDPKLQRWINRDPIAEWGGIDLFAFVANDPTGEIDCFGFEEAPPTYIMPPLGLRGYGGSVLPPLPPQQPSPSGPTGGTAGGADGASGRSGGSGGSRGGNAGSSGGSGGGGGGFFCKAPRHHWYDNFSGGASGKLNTGSGKLSGGIQAIWSPFGPPSPPGLFGPEPGGPPTNPGGSKPYPR